MKKKGRRVRFPDTSRHVKRTQTVVGSVKKPLGKRGRPRKTVAVASPSLGSITCNNSDTDKTASFDLNMTITEGTQKHSEPRSKPSGRLSTALCRLCHGKFSPRSLHNAFNKWPQDGLEKIPANESNSVVQSPLLFHTDFQRLVGVPLDRDPCLSEFICKKCHANFYKCHSILHRFLQRVNLPAVGRESTSGQKNARCPQLTVNHSSSTPASFTSDPKCLHSLVSWAHHHGEACSSCPDLKEVLEGQCWGSVRAVWGCMDGHSYIMDTQRTTASTTTTNTSATTHHTGNPKYTEANNGGSLRSGDDNSQMSEEEEEEEGKHSRGDLRTPGGTASGLAQPSPAAATPQTQSSALTDGTTTNTDELLRREEVPSPAPAQLEDRTADSDLSDRDLAIEDGFEDSRKRGLSDELFQPFPKKRPCRVTAPNKRRQTPKTPEEPKIKKKPGPKPGWKNKFKPKGEDLPNIYKCPYQGCTAVYRAPDGLKKHIREHHEEVRERPCPHPGCNKVFMIDRYLQRHVKLIHTEERNYICDQCGQTFKQRKHLSVHQMRHSGAKPLQCEVCGFQCRQRASLKYHMTKHKAEADLEFACLLCGKRFEKAHNLNVHMSMVHPLIQGEAQKDSSQPQQQVYSDFHTITVTGEVVQQDQDR
ncbi:zinc finger protein 276 [Lampris incognitus]|uniref:zinc finger protein 276 n=1 Tax=Lampris incognitus TaxID=2546036 RepID=UPI0024B5F01A|nr:zinc finger protein 276 [Lampris incognitus]